MLRRDARNLNGTKWSPSVPRRRQCLETQWGGLKLGRATAVPEGAPEGHGGTRELASDEPLFTTSRPPLRAKLAHVMHWPFCHPWLRARPASATVLTEHFPLLASFDSDTKARAEARCVEALRLFAPRLHAATQAPWHGPPVGTSEKGAGERRPLTCGACRGPMRWGTLCSF